MWFHCSIVMWECYVRGGICGRDGSNCKVAASNLSLASDVVCKSFMVVVLYEKIVQPSSNEAIEIQPLIRLNGAKMSLIHITPT